MQIRYKTKLRHFLTPLLFTTVCIGNMQAQTTKLSADKVHSNVGFNISLAEGLSRLTGKFNDFEIIVNYADADMTKSTIQASIKTASINTGNPGRDEHLTKPDFFDASQYPVITFSSDSIAKNAMGYTAYGSFSMHGITKKIQLPFTIVGKNAEGSVGFTARYKLSRRDFLIGKDTLKPQNDPYLSDDVMIEIDFIAEKPSEDK